jgi:hypothetical protein
MPEPFFQTDLTTLYWGDLREVLPGLPPDSIDCVWPAIRGSRCGASGRFRHLRTHDLLQSPPNRLAAVALRFAKAARHDHQNPSTSRRPQEHAARRSTRPCRRRGGDPGTPEAQTTETVKAWLESQRKGQDGFEYWQPDAYKPFTLYAVSSYEIMDTPSPSRCIVRIQSATRSGQPIVRLYAVTVFDGKISVRRAGGILHLEGLAVVEDVTEQAARRAKTTRRRSTDTLC